MEKAIRESADKASQGYPKVPKFLSILFQILEERKHSEFICWSPDGKIVVINKPVEFAEQLLPVYFKHSNYSSFVRQLNLYNFRKKKHCPQENAFAHAMFLRGRRDLLQYVKRKNSSMNPEERSCVQFEMYVNNEGEYDEMVDQNQSLKRVQEEMAQKIQRLEQVVDALTNENESLLHQCRRKKENEHFLKKVVNHIARIHGRPQISELIESMAYETLGNKLTLKSEPDRLVHTKTTEAQRYEKATPNFMNNDIFFEARSKDFNEKDYSTLQTPYLQTLASVSTMPEFNDPFDFQHDFDQIIDQKLRQQPPNSFDLEANSRLELDDFLCFDENPSVDVLLGQF